ncbi:transposase [Paraburkholderia sp. C35]|uniref:transposase n=1 Tax=Paraburkholderia sp. C35 TaxID=2126993 RepID=UPI000D693F15|nr:transposase [Paraburkholderia sp. C35]
MNINGGAHWQFALLDEDWKLVETLFTQDEVQSVGRRRGDPRQILNAILWIETTGASWKHLPANFPPTQTCYKKYLEWRRDGTLSKVHELLAIGNPLPVIDSAGCTAQLAA